MTFQYTPQFGFESALTDIYKLISDQGWSVSKVKFDKKADRWVAEAKSPHGEKAVGRGTTVDHAVRHLALAVSRLNHGRWSKSAAMQMLSMWKYNWIDQLKPIAEAYAKAPVYDPKAAVAYQRLAEDSKRRADILRNQLDIEEVHDPEPYANAQDQADDIHKRQHYTVSKANLDHPLWTPEQGVNFRIVHDVLGHAVSGGDFGWEGENRACQAHFPLLDKEAQQALFSECIGQTAYAAHYRSFGPQKVALFQQFVEPAQEAEGVYEGYQGTHPSQTQAPVAMPAVKPSEPVGLPWGTIAPHQEGPQGNRAYEASRGWMD
jgi:hypothetical protein